VFFSERSVCALLIEPRHANRSASEPGGETDIVEIKILFKSRKSVHYGQLTINECLCNQFRTTLGQNELVSTRSIGVSRGLQTGSKRFKQRINELKH